MKKLILTLLICLLPCYGWGGVDFDGTDDFINISDDATLDLDSDFTISVWVNIDDDTTSSRFFAGKSDFAGADFNFEVGALRNNHGTYPSKAFFVIKDTSANEPNIGGTTNVRDATWRNIIAIRDSTVNDELRVYVDGTKEGSTTDTTTTTITGNDPMYIGRARGAYQNGKITEVAIWNAILTQSEIDLLASSRIKRIPLQIQPANLKGYWPLDEGADGTTNCFNGSAGFKDLSGNGNDGTGDDGAGNDNLTCKAEEILTYN